MKHTSGITTALVSAAAERRGRSRRRSACPSADDGVAWGAVNVK